MTEASEKHSVPTANAPSHPPGSTDPETAAPGAGLAEAVDVGKILKHADQNDADEAYKVLREQHGEVIVLTAEEERKLLRKIDWNLMPLLCIVYGLNYLDKTTLSYASVMGLKVCWRGHLSIFAVFV
jgi:hypothetical protein